MIFDRRYGRAYAAMASLSVILVFSALSFMTLLAISLGAALMFIGIAIRYRIGALAGFLLIAAAAGSSIEILSLTTMEMLMTASLGLFLPAVILLLACLSAEIDEGTPERSGTRQPVLVAAIFAVCCLVCVPVAAAILGFISPGVSSQLSEMSEIAIVLVVATIGVVALSAGKPAKRRVPKNVEEEPSRG